MAGFISNGIAIDYADGIGKAKFGKREYWWDFNEWTGPLFYRRNWVELKRQPGEHHPVWKHFERWLKRYHRARKKAKSWETVEV
jgi:hypothetical protein